MNEKLFIRADDQVRDSFLLARQIYDSGFIPDALVVLWRGGTPIGVVIHEFLAYKGIETYHTAIKVETYVGIGQRREPRLEHIDRLLAHLKSTSRVLVIDDIFDSGSTMEKVVEALAPHVGEVRLATLYYKEASNTTRLVPDYFQRKTESWIVFPHELVGLSKDEISAKDSFISDLLD
ncbi:MAG: phosphoribosyltransferase [Kiritimatiellia bacterium]